MQILLTSDKATLTANTVSGPATVPIRPNRRTRNNLLRQY